MFKVYVLEILHSRNRNVSRIWYSNCPYLDRTFSVNTNTWKSEHCASSKHGKKRAERREKENKHKQFSVYELVATIHVFQIQSSLYFTICRWQSCSIPRAFSWKVWKRIWLVITPLSLHHWNNEFWLAFTFPNKYLPFTLTTSWKILRWVRVYFCAGIVEEVLLSITSGIVIYGVLSGNRFHVHLKELFVSAQEPKSAPNESSRGE